VPELRRHERLLLRATPAGWPREPGPAGATRERGVSRGVRRQGARGSVGFAACRASRRAPRSCTLVALLCALLAATGCVSLDVPFRGGPGPLSETVVQGEHGPKVLLLDIDDVITESDRPGPLGFGGRESTVARVREQLDLAREDPEVKGLLLRIQSPGGTVTGSDVVYHEILRFKKDRSVPVIAQLMGTATSGAYYVAMSADSVYAHPTTVTGSIGVILSSVNFSGLMQKLGIADQSVKSGSRKDTGSMMRPMTPEERAQLQSVIDDLYARFRSVVAQGRPKLEAQRLTTLADGRIYSAPQALAAGLVDGIQYLPDTIDEMKRRLGATDVRVVSYHRRREVRENIYSMPPVPDVVRVELAPPGLGPRLEGPAFLYLWWPGGE